MPWSRSPSSKSPSRQDDPPIPAEIESTSSSAIEPHDYFDEARRRLASMEVSSTCKRAATLRLLDTCENLQTGSQDDDLENVQNLYAAHLAICELEGAARKIPQQCRLQLPSNPDELARVLNSEGKAHLKACISSLHSQSQSWTSYSNNRRDAYIWCKVMRPGFDQDEYAKSLKEVISANSEISKALNDYLTHNKRRMQEQWSFMEDISVFKEQLARDLAASSKDLAETFAWLTTEASGATQKLMSDLAASVSDTKVKAEGLSFAVSSGIKDVEGLRVVIASTHKQLFDGVGSVSTAQELQLARTSEQVLRLQDHIELMINSRINAAVLNATDLLETMVSHIHTITSSMEETKIRMEEIETKMSGLTAVMPLLSNGLRLLSSFRWPTVLVLMALAGWRAAVLLAVAFASLEYLSSLVPPSSSLFASRFINVYHSVIDHHVLRPLSIVLIVFAILCALTWSYQSHQPKQLLSHIRNQTLFRISTGRLRSTDFDTEHGHLTPAGPVIKHSQTPQSLQSLDGQGERHTTPSPDRQNQSLIDSSTPHHHRNHRSAQPNISATSTLLPSNSRSRVHSPTHSSLGSAPSQDLPSSPFPFLTSSLFPSPSPRPSPQPQRQLHGQDDRLTAHTFQSSPARAPMLNGLLSDGSSSPLSSIESRPSSPV
ncbi:hypothetical protein MMC10_001743 [Thelotrema lepadinum]|nr:hypothetical protein [Thelotrema lepadinum]